jgi:hypothetical protein
VKKFLMGLIVAWLAVMATGFIIAVVWIATNWWLSVLK